MLDLLNEVLKLQILEVNKVYPIKQQEDDVVFLVRGLSDYSIAIPFNDERKFDESFVGIDLKTNKLNYKEQEFKVLYLSMIDTGDLQKFAYVGVEFIDIKNRSSLLANPYKWIDSWKDMFGDAKKKYLITDVLAELITLKCIYEYDKTAKWEGPDDNTHDIVCSDKVVEVKSTTNKTNSYVSINSKFQLKDGINEKLYLVRLEAKPYALSIDKVVNELIKLGYNEYELNEKLEKMGYKSGNRIRKVTYDVLSITEYDVNDINFPTITIEQINALTNTKNIVNYTLTLDMSTINGKIITYKQRC